MRQTPNNFIIIKSITIIFMYVSWLKKKSLLFSLLSHTLIIFFKGSNTLLSPFFIFFSTHSSLSWLSSFSLSGSLLAALFFLVRQSLLLLLPFLFVWQSFFSISSICGPLFLFLHYVALTYSAQTIFIYNLATHHNPITSQIRSLSTINHILLFQIGLVLLLS